MKQSTSLRLTRCSSISEVRESMMQNDFITNILSTSHCITPVLQVKKSFSSLTITEQNSSELVRHFLIESSAKGVRVKGSSQEPYFGKYNLENMTLSANPAKLFTFLNAVHTLSLLSIQWISHLRVHCNKLYVFCFLWFVSLQVVFLHWFISIPFLLMLCRANYSCTPKVRCICVCVWCVCLNLNFLILTDASAAKWKANDKPASEDKSRLGRWE